MTNFFSLVVILKPFGGEAQGFPFCLLFLAFFQMRSASPTYPLYLIINLISLMDMTLVSGQSQEWGDCYLQ